MKEPSSLPAELPVAMRELTLARFADHRRAWQANPALRACYARWYRRLAQELPPRERGPWVEIGSGPGLAAEFIPELVLTDIVQAPWHKHRVAAEALPYGDGEAGALVLFDVLHHVENPAAFFAEATRVLAPGGRIVMLEPYISPFSRMIYRLFHPELVDMSVDPLKLAQRKVGEAKDPFLSNQAIPTLIFCRGGGRGFAQMFPGLVVTSIERLAGPAYAATGGLSRKPVLPFALWKPLFALENRLPELLFRLLGFRVLVVIERR